MGIKYAEKLQIVPLRAPAATTSADTETAHVKIKHMEHLSFLCVWGAMTTDTAGANVKLYTSTAASTTNAVSQPFKYRLCQAVGGDTWGAITAATAAAGYTIPEASANALLLIDVEPASLYALDSDAEYAHLNIDGSGLATNPAFGVVFIGEPSYPRNDNLVTT